MVIYSKREFRILQAKKGFIVQNTNKDFRKGHTHLKSFNYAKVLIDNVIKKRRPKTKNQYLLSSHIRISSCEEYSKLIEELKVSRKRRKLSYNCKPKNLI